jgi:hypothetical protein
LGLSQIRLLVAMDFSVEFIPRKTAGLQESITISGISMPFPLALNVMRITSPEAWKVLMKKQH